jgi:arachidonate 15-lipoxygenase
MDLYLPQNDPRPEHRSSELSRQGSAYDYDYTQLEGIAMVEKVPTVDHPTAGWGVEVAKNLLPALINMAHVSKQERLKDPEHPDHHFLMELLHTAQPHSMDEILTRLEHHIQKSLVAGKHVAEEEQYKEVFCSLEVPEASSYWQEDENFAWLRIAGPNPMVIEGIPSIPTNFPVSEAHYQAALLAHAARVGVVEDTLASALADGRLFLTDYKGFVGFEEGDIPHGRRKYVRAPLALFAVIGEERVLMPVAIQCGQVPDTEHPIFCPGDGERWALAKLCVNVADGNLHQAAIHLAHTHLVTEPVVLASRRRLAPNHPILHLLRPHHEGTLYINDTANRRLLAEGGGVDSLLVGTLRQSRAAAAEATLQWSLRDSFLPVALAARRVDQTDSLPVFPYRDDAVLLWDAIRNWVSDYLCIFYASDADVEGDSELQAFVAELESQDGGRLRGVSEPGVGGGVATLTYLTDLVTALVFIPSAQHAAVNFPQLEQMAYCPNLPLASYQPPPGEASEVEPTLFQSMPTLDMAEFQMLLGRLLGGTRYTQLGHYSHHLGRAFDHHPEIAAALERFKAALLDVEDTIRQRNELRYRNYFYLQPSQVPQSINI